MYVGLVYVIVVKVHCVHHSTSRPIFVFFCVRSDADTDIWSECSDLRPPTGENLVEAPLDENLTPPEECRSRERKRDPKKWKVNILKRKRHHGDEYTDRNGKLHRARKVRVKKNCATGCSFKCSSLISPVDREEINTKFWILGREKQQDYFAQTTKQSERESERKRISYYLTVNGKQIRVCKDFYLETLDISQTRIKTYHKNKDPSVGTPSPYRTGNNNKKTSEAKLAEVHQHIQSFPRVESHYSRADSTCEYLDGGLSIRKMYRLYTEKQFGAASQPVHFKVYSNYFCQHFNIRFHKPKKDRCDKCEMFKSITQTGRATPEDNEANEKHVKSKEATRTERHRDTEIEDPATLVVSFDLENVFSLPKAEVSSFFYKRKLSVYNLTSIAHRSKRSYCTAWPETISGRSGNDIASSLLAHMNGLIEDHPDTRHLILWSDSCVPQNRNSVMSVALQSLLEKHNFLETITQKFCEPGHSSIQDVDALHSSIERTLAPFEIYSPVTLVRHLKTVRPQSRMQIKLSAKKDFFDYQSVAKQFDYNRVKYTQVKSLRYSKSQIAKVGYKSSFEAGDWTMVQVISATSTRKGSATPGASSRLATIVPAPNQARTSAALTKEKKADIRSMLGFMPEVDRKYMESII